MDSTDSRRQFLRLGGAGVAVALAGCLGALDSGGSKTPAYAEDIVPDGDGNVFALYTTWEGSDTGFPGDGGGIVGEGEREGNGGTGAGTGSPEDPLLLPIISPLAVGLFGGFTLGFTPLSPVLDFDGGGGGSGGRTNNESGEEGGDTEVTTEIDEIVMTLDGENFAFVMSGDIDTGELDELLTGESEVPGLAAVNYTESGQMNGYTRYEVGETDEGETDGENATIDVDIDAGTSAIGVSSEKILFGSPAALDRLTGGGGANPAADSDTVQWLLETAGDGEFGVTVYAPDGFNEDTFDGGDEQNDDQDDGGTGPNVGEQAEAVFEQLDATPVGLSGMLSEVSNDGGDANLAIEFESDIESSLEESIRSEFGTEAQSRSFEFDGNRVSIDGRYTDLDE